MAPVRVSRAVNLSLFLKHAPCRASQLPPPFLLPIAVRSFNSTPPIVEEPQTPDLSTRAKTSRPDRLAYSESPDQLFHTRPPAPPSGPAFSPSYDPRRAPRAPIRQPSAPSSLAPSAKTAAPEQEPGPDKPSATRAPLHLTPSVRENILNLASQPPFYIMIHIHGKPYLVTTGDTVRLPFLMHGVMPGDILRLDRASVLGSRDWTLRGGAPLGKARAPVTHGAVSTVEQEQEYEQEQQGTVDGAEISIAEPIVGKTEGLEMLMRQAQVQSTDDTVGRRNVYAYLDDRLFVCRAVVMGTEAEPERVKEKTKRRQRHVHRTVSQHRYTVIKIREISVNASLDSIDG